MATKTGIPEIETPPWFVTIDGATFSRDKIAAIEGGLDLINSHAGGKRSVTIEFTTDPGPPPTVTVTKIKSA